MKNVRLLVRLMMIVRGCRNLEGDWLIEVEISSEIVHKILSGAKILEKDC